MSINKAIKKQEKSFRRFVLLMSLIFLFLPVFMFKLKVYNIYWIIYLIIIEALICIAVVIRLNNQTFNFKDESYRLLIKNGIINGPINLPCDRVVLVHALKEDQDWSILLVIKHKTRNKGYMPINGDFFKKCADVAIEFNEIRRIHSEDMYSYIIIRNASLKKYELLNTIFKCCVGGSFTDSAIEKVKEYRGADTK